MIEAIVLAGGQGTRLRGIVHDLPKPMADIAGRPFLWWLMTRLNQQGVGRVILSVGYRFEAIQDYFGDAFNGTEISYSIETQPLGTGGAMRLALASAREPQVIVWNGDTYVDLDLQELIYKYAFAGIDLAVAVTYVNDVSRYGAVVIEEKSNKITCFGEKTGSVPGYINAGVYCLRRDIFAQHPGPAKFSFEGDFLARQLTLLRVTAHKEVRAFVDIGVPEDYARAQTLIPTLAAKILRKGYR
jgi:D-glycero-alpha-D-manno-heptose 1-phosphate guanylyltransferase